MVEGMYFQVLIHALLRTERFNTPSSQKGFIATFTKVAFTSAVSSVAEFGSKDGSG